MTSLVIDIGNTFTKIAVFDNDSVVHFTHEKEPDYEKLQTLIRQYKVKELIISSVKEHPNLDMKEIENINVFYFNHTLPVPVTNKYQTPETLGADRLAAVIGAKKIFPDKAVLVIDAGTCITYDFINEQNAYYGGSISPGLNMRLKAMHHFTGKLPEVQPDNAVTSFTALYGKNTKESLISGTINGLLFEVEGYIKQYNHQNPDLRIILCGGDSTFFDTRLKNSIFAHQILLEPNLVMIGLNTVVKYQHDKKDK